MENELYHHGVKGQHWGKRNGPPYPLYRKSSYYKKTGQRPPGYTGNKKGKSDSGGTNKSGRVGKMPSDMQGYRRSTNEEIEKVSSRKSTKAELAEAQRLFKERDKGMARAAISVPMASLGTGLTAAGVGSKNKLMTAAGIGTTAASLGLAISAKRKLNRMRSDLDAAANAKLKRQKISNMRSYKGVLYTKDSKGKIGGLNDYSDDERRAKLRKRILIGAGVAAGLAGGALVGRKLYQRKAALGAQGVADEAKNLHKNFLKNRAAQKEATSIKEGLDKAYQNSSKAIKAERAGIINKKLSLQNEGLGLKDAKGIRAYFKRRKNAKALNEIEQRLAANATKSANATKNYSKKLADNALASDKAKIRYETAKRDFESAKNRETMLKRIGNKQALASTLGLGALGGAVGYGASKPSRSKNQNRGTIGGLTKRMTASSTDSAVTRRAKAAYNSMSDAEFKRKYSVSKAEYARRVEKYGDPYKNSPMAKLGRRLRRR